MQELTPGLELGARFVLVRRIGRGGSAEVWLAADRAQGGEVALKFFDESVTGDAARLARLEAEVGLAASLPRARTVALHGLERMDGRVFLVMEYLEGGDLGQMRGRSFESWSRAVDDVAAALEALHARGLVHRDLKCANVFLDGDGHARLGDFGLTALAGSAESGHSPYNVSPQQLRGEPAQPADDLYAFGALLYELIAGHPPYYPDITGDRVLHEPVPPLVPRGTVPAGVRELALRLLSKSANQRPASATIARARLAVAAADESGALKPLAHEVQPPPARGRRSRLLPTLLGVAALAAVAVVFLLPRAAVEDSVFARKAREEAEQAGVARQTAASARAAEAEARTLAETARTRFDGAFKSLDARAAARWATAEFARARDGGAAAAQRFAVGDYRAAVARLGRGVEAPRVARGALAQGAGGRRAAGRAGARRREDRRGARVVPARARDPARPSAGHRGTRARRPHRRGACARGPRGPRRTGRPPRGRRGGLSQGACDRRRTAGCAGKPRPAGRGPQCRRLFGRDVARLRRCGRGPHRCGADRVQPGARRAAGLARGHGRRRGARPGPARLGAAPPRGAGAHGRERRALGRGAHGLARSCGPRTHARIRARGPRARDAARGTATAH